MDSCMRQTIKKDFCHIFMLQKTTDNFVRRVMRHTIVDWNCSKTQTLLVIWKTRNQLHRNFMYIWKSNIRSCELDVPEVNFDISLK